MMASWPEARSETKTVFPRTASASGSSFPTPGVGSRVIAPRLLTLAVVTSARMTSSLAGELPNPSFSFSLKAKLCQSTAPSVPASVNVSLTVSSRVMCPPLPLDATVTMRPCFDLIIPQATKPSVGSVPSTVMVGTSTIAMPSGRSETYAR
jgi:hypothetical protein